MFKFLIIVLASVFVLTSCREHKFAEFTITDVSKPHTFIDSVSAFPYQHNTLTMDIIGELDSNAILNVYAYSNNHGIKQIKLKKGKTNQVNGYMDYYEGDTLALQFIPSGTKKGYLKIRTRIN